MVDEATPPVQIEGLKEERSYSRAFERMVQEPNDLVGLLAYALLKQNLREEKSRKIEVGDAFRDPSKVTINLYREAAEKRLNAFGASVIDSARDEIQESAIFSAISESRSGIISHVTSKTGLGPAITSNVLAWAFTLLLTILVLGGLAVSGTADKMLDRVDKSLQDAVDQNEAPASKSPVETPADPSQK